MSCPGSELSEVVSCESGVWDRPKNSRVKCVPYPRVVEKNHDTKSICPSIFEAFNIEPDVQVFMAYEIYLRDSHREDAIPIVS